jgi:hypothetical protein
VPAGLKISSEATFYDAAIPNKSCFCCSDAVKKYSNPIKQQNLKKIENLASGPG